jgi:PleD family two-component response regulator
MAVPPETDTPHVDMSPTQPQVDLPAPGGLRARILIVDDSYMVAEMLSNFLGKQGCAISYALDGSAALDQVRQSPPDLIIADWVMPNLDGLELCRQLRQSPEYAWVYYIIMTAREGNDNMERALEAGADEFLSKPFQAAELMTRVRAGLRIVEVRRRRQLKSFQPALNPSEPVIGTRQNLVSKLPQCIAYSRSQVEPLSLFILRLVNLAPLSRGLSPDLKKTLLSQFTQRLMGNLREGDDLFRYDEGQFIVILSGTTLPAAQIAAERCCLRMVQEPFVLQGQILEIQIQYGTATLEASDDPQGMALLRRAAQGLRDSKHQANATLSSPAAQPMEPVAADTESSASQDDRVRILEAENLELRMRVSSLSKLEVENKQLKQRLQQVMMQLKQLQS